jgi:uncharacterized protein YciW
MLHDSILMAQSRPLLNASRLAALASFARSVVRSPKQTNKHFSKPLVKMLPIKSVKNFAKSRKF